MIQETESHQIKAQTAKNPAQSALKLCPLSHLKLAPPFCVEVAVAPAIVPEEVLFEVEVAIDDFSRTYISPVVSELMKRRPWLSNASPTGRKQESGQLELCWLVIISVKDVVLSEASTGSPLAKSMVETL